MSGWRARVVPVLLAILVNVNLLANGFVYDDGHIFRNPWLHSAKYIPELITRGIFAYSGAASPFYRPLHELVVLGCYLLFGTRAWGYHLVSIALHALCTLQVFRVTLRMKDETAAFWAALLFAVLPVHTESVAWYSAMAEPLFTLFGLLAFIWYMERRVWWSLGAFFLAMCSKETAIMILPLLLAWELVRSREGQASTLAGLAKTLPWFVMAVGVYSAMRFHALGSLSIGSGETEFLSPATKLYSLFFLFGNYIRYLIYPYPFSLYHTFHPVTTPTDWRFLAGVAAAIALLALRWTLWRRGSRLWLAVFWIAVPLVPVLVFNRSSGDIFGERYLYFPSVGFCALVGALASRRSGFTWLLIAMTAAGSAVTIRRNAEFRDDVTLWRAALVAEPDSPAIRATLASAYLVAGRGDLAMPLLAALIQEKPRDFDTRMGYGTALAASGHFSEARANFERAAALRPASEEPWFNLGLMAEAEHDAAAAEQAYRKAIALNPTWIPAQENLGILLAEQKRWDEAAEHFRAAKSFTNLERVLAMARADRVK